MPEITITPSQTTYNITKGDTVNINVTATDADEDDTVTLEAPEIPDGATFNNLTGIFVWNVGDVNYASIRSVQVVFLIFILII